MSKTNSVLTFAFILFAATSIYAAEPFQAPAVFDLGGSTIYLEAKVNVPIVGDVDVNITPNPVPIAGQVVVETLDGAGNWTGYGEGSGSATINAPVVGKLNVSGEAGGSAQGVFDFANNLVTFYTNDSWAKIKVSGQQYDFNIDDGTVQGTFDGKYIRFATTNDTSFNLLGFTFKIHYEINAVGELKPAENLEVFIDTNKSNYNSGDRFTTAIGFKRTGGSITVDAWLVLLDSTGALLFFPGFTTTANNIPNLVLPANSETYDRPIFDQILPGNNPPIQSTGTYIIAIGFSRPGTADFYCIASKQFNYNQ